MARDKDDYGEREAEKRRDEIIRRMLATPPKPFTPKPKKKVTRPAGKKRK